MSSGPVPGLSQAQATNARTIAAVATAHGGDRAAQIALMVALTESDLLVLANPNDPSSGRYANQGVGYDHDSLGLFQQRPSWGTAAQRTDPATSTALFLEALLTTPRWSSLAPAVAAQLVQRSAYDGTPALANHFSATVGGNYRARQDEATRLLAQLLPGGQGPDCGGGNDGIALGSGSDNGLPPGWTVPASASAAAATAVTFAAAQLGKPYQWGAAGPDRYDCSGLTMAAWMRAGVPISRTTYDQLHDGVATDSAHLRPGDLVLTPGSDGTVALPGHVGLYIGEGLVVAAPRTGDVVKVVTYDSFVARGLSALRHIG